ncbi:MAG: cytidine deaminase [Saprospiraceae bacterium]
MKKEINLNAVIEVYEKVEDLPAADQNLLHRAKQALPTAFAPYSGFQVSAAVLLSNGEILVGTNHENAAYPMCLCAERTALAAAHAQFPGVPVQALAITVKSKNRVIDEPASPCGACRQVICETEHRYKTPIQLILQGETGIIYKLKSGKDLLPLAFDGDFL